MSVKACLDFTRVVWTICKQVHVLPYSNRTTYKRIWITT